MRNRAKCKLCGDVIESKQRHDYITCSCGEITIDGGKEYRHASFKNIENFMCVDDEGNEIVPTYSENTSKDENTPEESFRTKPTKEELLQELDEMIKTFEHLPPGALYAPVTHSDFCSLLMLVYAILRAD